MNTTTNEAAVLTAIALHEFSRSNGHAPDSIEEHHGTYCWVDEFATAAKLTIPQTKGVLSSLVQKKLVRIEKYDDVDNTIDFTAAGFEAYLATR